MSLILESVQSGPISLKVQTEVTVPHPGAGFSFHEVWYLWTMDIGVVVCSCWLQFLLVRSVWRQYIVLRSFVMSKEEQKGGDDVGDDVVDHHFGKSRTSSYSSDESKTGEEGVFDDIIWGWRILELPLRQNYCFSLTMANVANLVAALMRITHMAMVRRTCKTYSYRTNQPHSIPV